MTDDLQKLIDELEHWGAEPKQVLSETFMNDGAFYKSCLHKFNTDILLQTLQESLVSETCDTAIRAVHTMKGNADSLGLFPIMDAAMTVLKDLRANNFTQARIDMPALEKAYAEFKTVMTSF